MHLPGVYSTSRPHHLPVPDPLGVRALSLIIKRERPDIVHAHNWIVNSALALRRHSAGRPPFGLVLTLHDFSHVCATKRLMRAGRICQGPAVGRCLPCATSHYGPIVGPITAGATAAMRPWKNRAIDHIVSVSRAVAEGNCIPDSKASSVIPNFVLDSTVPPPTPHPIGSATVGATATAEDRFILFVGELSREKGIDMLLRAYQLLGSHRPPLMLIGRRMPDTPVQLPEGAQIHLDWAHEEVLAAFRRCMMAVLPSVCRDACPTTVLEAMASGSPVVTTSIGGMVDMITNEHSGLLVPPGDDRELARAMNRILVDEQLRARLCTGARDKVREFTGSAVAEQLETVYSRVAAQIRRDHADHHGARHDTEVSQTT
jgi:glycogen synthase